jgi:hypothetical protein
MSGGVFVLEHVGEKGEPTNPRIARDFMCIIPSIEARPISAEERVFEVFTNQTNPSSFVRYHPRL